MMVRSTDRTGDDVALGEETSSVNEVVDSSGADRDESGDGPRVCLVIPSFFPVIGGGESHARLLARELVRLGTPLFVLTRRNLPGSAAFEQIDGYPVFRVPPTGMPRWGKYLMMAPAFWFLARRRHDYDVIYVCGMRTMGIVGVLCAHLFDKKCVLRSESRDELRGDHIARDSRLSRLPVLGRLAKAWLSIRNHILMKADQFLAISSAIEEEYREAGVPAGKITTIPNGIDTDEFAPCPAAEKRVIRDQLQLPDKTLAMYTGKLNRGKGLELLLEVWADLVEEYPDAHLVLVGSGANQFLSCEQELRDCVHEKSLGSHVTFTGATRSVASYLMAADLFVMPSEDESQCISLLEAMASGLPAVATAVGGVPEYFVSGRHGVLVDAQNGLALLRGLRHLLEAASHSGYAERARATVVQRFRIEIVARRHQDYFKEVLLS